MAITVHQGFTWKLDSSYGKERDLSKFFLTKRVHSNEKNHHTGSCTLNVNINHSGLYAGFFYDRLHLAGDIV